MDRAPTSSDGRSSGDPIANRFRLQAPLDEGGAATVWRARQILPNGQDHPRAGPCVIKFLRREASPDMQARFEHEALLLSMLKDQGHGGFPEYIYHYIGRAPGEHFIAMEQLEGRTLHELMCCEPEYLTPKAISDIALQIADIVHSLHSLAQSLDFGIYHRDLSPRNCVIAGDGQVRLLDLGLAKIDDPGLARTRSHGVGGTEGFMAPEQATGRRDLGPGVDVYGLGGILYMLVRAGVQAGLATFHYNAEVDVLRGIFCDEDYIGRELAPSELPAPFRAIIQRALRHRPEQRFPSMSEFAEALRMCQAGLPTTFFAKPSPPAATRTVAPEKRPAPALAPPPDPRSTAWLRLFLPLGLGLAVAGMAFVYFKPTPRPSRSAPTVDAGVAVQPTNTPPESRPAPQLTSQSALRDATPPPSDPSPQPTAPRPTSTTQAELVETKPKASEPIRRATRRSARTTPPKATTPPPAAERPQRPVYPSLSTQDIDGQLQRRVVQSAFARCHRLHPGGPPAIQVKFRVHPTSRRPTQPQILTHGVHPKLARCLKGVWTEMAVFDRKREVKGQNYRVIIAL